MKRIFSRKLFGIPVIVPVLMIVLAGGVWALMQLRSIGNILGTKSSEFLQYSADGVDYTTDIPAVFNLTGIALGETRTVNAWFKPTGTLVENKLGVKVENASIVQGAGPAADSTNDVRKYLVITKFNVDTGPYEDTLLGAITDTDGDGVKTIFDLQSDGQKVSMYDSKKYIIDLQFKANAPLDTQGDSVSPFDVVFTGI